MHYIYLTETPMKPLQMNQKKTAVGWTDMLATNNITFLHRQLEQIQKSHPVMKGTINGQKTRQTIATLLVEYYKILFNPDYRYIFREPYLKDLSLLFPTKETISITPGTNFILLPLPLPTYDERTDRGSRRYLYNCPFMDYQRQPDVNEFIRDMDYSVDSNRGAYAVKSNNQRANLRKFYPHTNPLTKISLTNQPLPFNCARLRVYKYRDVPKWIAETLPNYNSTDSSIGSYSMIDINNTSNQKVRDWINREYSGPNADKLYKQSFVYNKFTFLEIPNGTSTTYYNLKDLSKAITDNMFNRKDFASYFKFDQVGETELINYFIKQALPMNEYCPLQIRSGIDRLNKIINRNHNHIVQQQTTQPHPATQDTEPNHDSPYYVHGKGKPSRQYLYTCGAKLYKDDGTVVEFDTYDNNELQKISKDKLIALYSNNSSSCESSQQ